MSARDGLVVVCAANNYDGVKLADQQLVERLAPRAPVLYVDPPVSHLTGRNDPAAASSLEGPRLRREAAGFWRLTPVVLPRPMRPGIRAITEQLVRRALARAVHAIGQDVRAVISAWPQINAFGACGEALSVWWAQDDFAAGAALMGTSAERVAAGEVVCATAANLVVAANPEVARRWRLEGLDVELIPYGSNPETFADVEIQALAPGVELSAPVVVLVGHLNERVDPALLHAVVDRGVSLLLIGPSPTSASGWMNALTARPGVRWVGPQPFAALPRLLAHAHAGVVPYVDSAFNRASFPLKTLEYLAAGLPVVSTDLPGVRWLQAPPELVTVANGPESFADAVASAVALPLTSLARGGRRDFARRHSYDRRAIDLLAAIDRRLRVASGAAAA